MVDLSIIIVNWNTRDLLAQCLESVASRQMSVVRYKSPDGSDQPTDDCLLTTDVWVVDNASTDGSTEMVRERFPRVHLIENEENVGFAQANNQVIRQARGRYLLLLNSDTVVHGNAIPELVGFLDQHPKAAAVGPRLEHPEGTLGVLHCGYLPTLRTTFNQSFFLYRLFPNVAFFRGTNLPDIGPIIGPCEVEWLSAACLMVRREVIAQVGLLDETQFMYSEDVEWCARMIRAGWTLHYLPTARVTHHLGASSNKDSVSVTWVESAHQFFYHQHGRLATLCYDVLLASGFALRAVAYQMIAWMRGEERWQRKAAPFRAYTLAACRLFLALLREA